MDSQLNILALLGCFLAGALAGALLVYRGLRLQSRQQLESELKKAKLELHQHQSQTTEHFHHAAFLMGNLTRNLRDLHNYMAESSKMIGNIDIAPTLTGDPSPPAPLLGNNAVIAPPLDYAPKKSDIGTLSESYGLREEPPKKQPIPDGFQDEQE